MKEQLLCFIQSALNKYLALDPEFHHRLKQLENKIITIELKGINMTFQLAFTDKITIHTPAIKHANTIISGTPLRLLQMSFSENKRQQFFSDDVTIEGDLELGQHVMDLFNQMEIDHEEHLSQWLGDIPAHNLGRVVRKIKKVNSQSKEDLLNTINEYIHEEINLFPTKEEIQDFFQDIDDLRMHADRVEARVSALLNKSNLK